MQPSPTIGLRSIKIDCKAIQVDYRKTYRIAQ